MNFIPLASPDIRESDIALVNEVLRSGMLVQGKYVGALEKEFSNIIKCKESIAVSNGTATLHLALKVLGIKPGDEVIVPAFSYVATANVVEIIGATPVFVDIDLATFNIDVSKIEAAITPATKAILPVHEFGLACDIESVMVIAKKYGIHVIEDAACALGAMQNGKPVGSYGVMGSFSLHPRKSITSGEGGIISVNDITIAKKLKQLRNHGIEMTDDGMVFEEAGFNYRMTDFQAALAYGQIQRLTEIFDKKRRLAEVYYNVIKNSEVILPFLPEDRNHTWQTFHILIGEGLHQLDVINKLRKVGIGANYGAQCIPDVKYYAEKYNYNSAVLYPNAYTAYTKGIALPCYEKLTKEQIKYISININSLC